MDVPTVKRIAVALVAFTLLYNVAEGALSIWSGVRADSLVLLTFGADSYVEVLAASAVLWRLSYDDEQDGERAERRAIRLIGGTFLVLAVAVVFTSMVSLSSGEGASGSLAGLIVLAASLIVMPVLSFGKLWAAARTGMPVIAAEAKETIACSYLSLTAFAGVVAVIALGWWWLDAVAALAMVPWLVREGMEGVRGDACFDGAHPCFCRPCAFGLRDCARTCCATACC
jgi:divalent metal cation (Fe/Co/Zn/Cd) transporter